MKGGCAQPITFRCRRTSDWMNGSRFGFEYNDGAVKTESTVGGGLRKRMDSCTFIAKAWKMMEGSTGEIHPFE
jgi:hypothetical protein